MMRKHYSREESHIKDNRGMALNEIMGLWESKKNTDISNTNDIDQASLERLGDEDHWEDDDDIDMPDIAEYRDILRQSSACQWLQSCIHTTSSLQIPGQDSAADSIGDRILQAAGRPARFSRKQTQQIQMQFTVDLDLFSFIREQQYDETASVILANAITLTGYGKNLQATTCSKYMKQTWPETGPQLLTLLGHAAEDSSATCECK
jgi:hypothetical protein